VATLPQLPEGEPEHMSAEELLVWGYGEYGDKLCLTCSWQKQSSVLVHMVSELELEIPVIELDTQLFFRETYETRDRLVERYGLELERPNVITVAEQHQRETARKTELRESIQDGPGKLSLRHPHAQGFERGTIRLERDLIGESHDLDFVRGLYTSACIGDCLGGPDLD